MGPTEASSRKSQCAIGYQQLPHGDQQLPLSPGNSCSQQSRKISGSATSFSEELDQTQASNARCNNLGSLKCSGEKKWYPECRPKPCSASATPLQLLNLQIGFSEQDLRAAFKKAVLIWHPDRPVWQGSSEKDLQDATDMFRRVKQAYEVLSTKNSG